MSSSVLTLETRVTTFGGGMPNPNIDLWVVSKLVSRNVRSPGVACLVLDHRISHQHVFAFVGTTTATAATTAGSTAAAPPWTPTPPTPPLPPDGPQQPPPTDSNGQHGSNREPRAPTGKPRAPTENLWAPTSFLTEHFCSVRKENVPLETACSVRHFCDTAAVKWPFF